jgi:hypothetical protein
LKKLDLISRVLAQTVAEVDEIEESEREVVAEYANLENKMTKLRLTFSLSKLPEKLCSIQNEGLELKRQVEIYSPPSLPPPPHLAD